MNIFRSGLMVIMIIIKSVHLLRPTILQACAKCIMEILKVVNGKIKIPRKDRLVRDGNFSALFWERKELSSA